MKKRVIWWIIVDVILAGLMWTIGRIERDDLIIAVGVRGAAPLRIGALVALALLAALANYQFIRSAVKQYRQTAPQQPLRLQTARDGTFTTEQVRRDLKYLSERQPYIGGYMKRGLLQLDDISKKQESLKQILNRKPDASLQAVVDTIDNAGKSVSRRLYNMMDLAIVLDASTQKLESREINSQQKRAMEQYLRQNDQVLVECDKLLSQTVQYLGSRDSEVVGSHLELEAMTEAMQALTKLEGVDGIIAEQAQSRQ